MPQGQHRLCAYGHQRQLRQGVDGIFVAEAEAVLEIAEKDIKGGRDKKDRKSVHDLRSPIAPGRSAVGRDTGIDSPDHAAEAEAFAIPGGSLPVAAATKQPAAVATAASHFAGHANAAHRGYLLGVGSAAGPQ